MARSAACLPEASVQVAEWRRPAVQLKGWMDEFWTAGATSISPPRSSRADWRDQQRSRARLERHPHLSRTHDKAQAYAIPHFTGQKIMMVLP